MAQSAVRIQPCYKLLRHAIVLVLLEYTYCKALYRFITQAVLYIRCTVYESVYVLLYRYVVCTSYLRCTSILAIPDGF